MTWADKAAPIIAQVIRDVGRSDMKALRKELTHAYPWEARTGYPYKVWLGEIQRQLGHLLNAPRFDPHDRQLDMFDP